MSNHLGKETGDTSESAPDGGELDDSIQPISGHAALTVEDFTTVWFALPQNRAIVLRFTVWVLAIPFFALLTAWMNSLSSGEAMAPMPWYLVPATLAGVAALSYGLRRGRSTWAKNAVADLRGADGVDYGFDDEGISVTARGRAFRLAWDTLSHSLELPTAFVIYTTPAAVLVVPKRAFSPSDLPNLSDRLREYVPNRPLRGTQRFGRGPLVWFLLMVIFLAVWRFLAAK